MSNPENGGIGSNVSVNPDDDEDDLPDLESIEEGDELEVYYVSSRSGNEVSRSGVVDDVLDREEEDGPRVYVKTDNPEPLKTVYCALTYAETKQGNDCVAAFSLTTEPDGMEFEDGPEMGRTYTFTQTVSRTTILGIVDRVVRVRDSGRYPL